MHFIYREGEYFKAGSVIRCDSSFSSAVFAQFCELIWNLGAELCVGLRCSSGIEAHGGICCRQPRLCFGKDVL